MTEERNVRRIKELGDLHDLLLRAAPPGDDGAKPSIPTLARALKISHWSIYVWIKRDKVPARRVKRIVEIGDGRVAIEDFHAYTYV